MTNKELQLEREKLTFALGQVWDLYGNAQRYITGDTEGPSESCPDLCAAVERLIPSCADSAANTLEECSLGQLVVMIDACRACQLGLLRKHSVPGEGVMNPRVMVVGEGPGAEEDRTGHPFVGRAGQYLDRWLAALDLSREKNVYISNIVKCRPPNNRDPFPEETTACLPYLRRQITLVGPETILCVGRIAAHILLEREDGVGKLRGSFFRFEGIPLLVTYHPSAVLRNPGLRAPVWKDLQQLASFLHIDLPRTRG